MLWANEAINVSAAQRYAHAAVRDGLDGKTIHDMASLATWGRNMQNVERDLHRWTRQIPVSGLKTHATVIQVFDQSAGVEKLQQIPILLPSDVLSALWSSNNSNLWDVCIGATAEKCQTFWQHAEMDWAASHPVVQSTDST